MSFYDVNAHRIECCPMSGCWLWAGARSGEYGKLSVDGESLLAHRAAYEDRHGEGSAEGLVVRHKCDTPPCVNPDHLLGGTHLDNARDRHERGRFVSNGCVPGASPNRKLDEEAVAKIKRQLADGWSPTGIAESFGITYSNVWLISRERIWAHVAPELKIMENDL